MVPKTTEIPAKNPTSLLETTLNTRELGGYKTSKGSYTKYNTLLRSDEITSPHEWDIAFLQSIGITRIIDMRSKKECTVSPSPFPSMKQFQYYHIPIEEGSRIPASPADVPHSYMRIAGAKNMPEVFRHIAMGEGGTLFHCRAGKDRTGVVAAILLLSASVGWQDIVADYMLTKEYNQKRFQKIQKRYPRISADAIIPREEYITGFLTMFLAKYGSAGQYFQEIGIENYHNNLLP